MRKTNEENIVTGNIWLKEVYRTIQYTQHLTEKQMAKKYPQLISLLFQSERQMIKVEVRQRAREILGRDYIKLGY